MLVRVRRLGYEVVLRLDDSRLDEVLTKAWEVFGDRAKAIGSGGEFDKDLQPKTGSGIHAPIPPGNSRRKAR